MSGWQIQIRRSAPQMKYWHSYLNARGQRGTVQSMVVDILADNFVDEGPFSAETTEPSEWLRRHFDCYQNAETGRSIYTIPGPVRYEAVQAFIEAAGFLTPAALLDHSEPAYTAALVASANGYDRFADQTFLDHTFRGTFLGTAMNASTLIQSVLLCHFVPGEEYFRVRIFETRYKRAAHQSDTALFERAGEIDWDSWSMRDGFAAFNPVNGALFLLRGEGGGASGYDVSDFAFDNKGRRVLALTAEPHGGGEPSMRFQLCQQPADIDRALGVLRRISGEMQCAIAAE